MSAQQAWSVPDSALSYAPAPLPPSSLPWQPGSPQPPSHGLRSTTGGVSAHELLTVSTGSVPLDAAAGAVAGYLVAPGAASGKPGWALAGAAATGLFGVLGLLGVLGAAWWQSRRT